MARLPALIDALAAVDGRPRGAIDHVGRAVREAGLIQTTKRGRGAAEMTAMDAARLVLGLYGADQPAAAAHAAALLGEAKGHVIGGSDKHPTLAPVIAGRTLTDTLAATIELGRQLAPSTLRTQRSLSPFMEPQEADQWPAGFSVLLTLRRPHLIGHLTLVWPDKAMTKSLNIGFVAAEPDHTAIVPFEVITRVHTGVLIALHGALFSPAALAAEAEGDRR